MTKNRDFSVVSGWIFGKNDRVLLAAWAGKIAFSCIGFFFLSCMANFLLPGRLTGADASRSGYADFSAAFRKMDFQNIPGAFLLSEALPRGRIRMTKILRASPGSPYIAQYNPLINSKILLT